MITLLIYSIFDQGIYKLQLQSKTTWVQSVNVTLHFKKELSKIFGGGGQN